MFLLKIEESLDIKIDSFIKSLKPLSSRHRIVKSLKSLSTNRFSSLFGFQDVIPKELQTHLVYKFLCGNWNVTYYGKTERHLNVRSSEHIVISHLTGKRVECKPSAVSYHLLLYNHDSNFNEFTILCRDNNGSRRLIKESILISRDSPVLNKNTASIPLLLFD